MEVSHIYHNFSPINFSVTAIVVMCDLYSWSEYSFTEQINITREKHCYLGNIYTTKPNRTKPKMEFAILWMS